MYLKIKLDMLIMRAELFLYIYLPLPNKLKKRFSKYLSERMLFIAKETRSL